MREICKYYSMKLLWYMSGPLKEIFYLILYAFTGGIKSRKENITNES